MSEKCSSVKNLRRYELYPHKLLNTLETATSFRVKATAIEGDFKI
jgi:hypothetical protein